ncbi:type II secretion system F family protein [Candidatus Woesearchaeota archaeon]|nr:type II secretion system F family protein [Candidatus Woesearchaeota archaeon]
MPGLAMKLKQAGFLDDPAVFLQKTAMSAFYITTGLMLVIVSVFSRLDFFGSALFLLFPVLFIVLFFYLLKMPDIVILRIEREIEKDIVFAGRFLIIEMNSGVPLYDAMRNVSKNYEAIGKYFRDIVEKVDLGTPMEDAIGEQIDLTPSSNFRKLLWQLLNSLKTGADISKSVGSTVDQIAKEHLIQAREYGRKLNPLAMFYLTIAIIVPSIGTVMLIILSSFLSLNVDLSILLGLSVFMGFVQFMFLGMIRSQRPSFEM